MVISKLKFNLCQSQKNPIFIAIFIVINGENLCYLYYLFMLLIYVI